MTTPPPAPREWTEPRPPPPTWLAKNWMTIAIAVAIVVTLGVIAVVWSGKGATMDGASAKVACREFVERQLKSPSTADFTGEAVNGSGPFIVTGAVDAQNSFGATVRETYACTVRADGDTWRLESLTGL